MPYPMIPPPKRSLGIFGGLKNLLAERQAEREAADAKQQALEDRVFGSLRQARKDVQDEDKNQAEVRWLDERVRASKNPVVKPAAVPRERLVTVMKDGKRVLLPESQASGMEAPGPTPPPAPSLSFQTIGGSATEPGEVVGVDPKTGKVVTKVGTAKAPGNAGSASLTKAVATNKAQLAVIDDALKELDQHPSAVGLTRGLPLIGDRLDPRIDPNGVAARAQIANISSLKIHDRSGAAVSVHEFPRLAPFIPTVNDPPAAIRIKLQKLREAIALETDALSQASGSPKGGNTPAPSDPEFDALMAKYGTRPPV